MNIGYKLKKLMGLAALAGGCITEGRAQQELLSRKLQPDTALLTGKLANGLTYYIRHNALPEKKVELRLVVKAGSVLETEAQQGLAHFMEHMEFNGLKHFPKNKLVDYLEKIGVGFGSDLNANTTSDRTYYILPIPTDNPTNLPNGLQILQDWIQGATLSTEEINAERGVILEELKMRDRNASTRMMNQYLPHVLNNSRYANRLPGGKDAVVAYGNPEEIRKFYHTWYRPELMAVILVGDISKEKGLQMVHQYFDALKNPAQAPPVTYYPVAPYTSTQGQIVTDKEATGYSVAVAFPATTKDTTHTLGDARNEFIEQIFATVVNKRFAQMTQKPSPAFSGASLDLSGTVSGFTLFQRNTELNIVPNKDINMAIDSAVYVLLQIKKYGFTNREIQPVKALFLSQLENAWQERNTTYSANIAEACATAFMGGETMISMDSYYQYAQELLPGITADDINACAQKLIQTDAHFYALAMGPDTGSLALPDSVQLVTAIHRAFQQQPQPAQAYTLPETLIEHLPAAGTIVATRQDSLLHTTTFTLSNGIRVTVKPTDFKNDQVMLTAIKPGGSDALPVAQKANAEFLLNAVGTMGFGAFTPTQLGDFLAGSNVTLNPSLGKVSVGLNGSSNVSSLATLVQLAWLGIMQPRKDAALLAGFKDVTLQSLPNQYKDPGNLFSDTITKVYYHNSPLAPITFATEAQVNALNADTLVQLYHRLFGGADGYHFIFTGNINIDSLKPLLCTYLASIPAKGETRHFSDNGLRPITGRHSLHFYAGENDKSTILDFHYGQLPYSGKNLLLGDMVSRILTIRIMEKLREQSGLIYSGGVSSNVTQFPYPQYSLVTQLPCDPRNVTKIMTQYNALVQALIANGPSETDIKKVKKAMQAAHQENIKTNDYWESLISKSYIYGEDARWWLSYPQQVENITREDIRKAARLLLTGNRFTAVSYPARPEKSDTTHR